MVFCIMDRKRYICSSFKKHSFFLAVWILNQFLLTMDKLPFSEIVNSVLFCSSPDPILILDISGTINDCNEATEKIYDFPKKNICGKKSFHFFTEKSCALFKKKFPDIIKGIPQEDEVEVVSGSGTIVKLWRKGVPFIGKDGNLKGVIIFDRDISAIKLSEKKLKEQKEYLEDRFDEQTNRIEATNNELRSLIKELKKAREKNQTILNAIPDILFVIGIDGRFLDFNSKDNTELQVRPEEFVGKTIENVTPPDIAALTKSMIQKTIETNELQTFEFEFKGKPNLYEARMVYKNDLEVLVIIRDITEAKKIQENLNNSERLFRTLVNSTQEAVIAINSDSEIVIFNPAAEEMFQVSKSEITKSNIERILPDKYKSQHPAWVSSYFKTGKPDGAMGKTLELQAKRNDGDLFDIEISISPGDMGNERIVVAIIRDITLRKKAEKELLAAKEKAEENDRLKSAFLANMSHEIRTPMNSILGFSNLLPEAKNVKERKEYVNIIISNGHLLMNLINDIIDVSKIEAGIAKAYNTTFLLSEELDNIYNLFSVNKKCMSGQVKLIMKIPRGIIEETINTDKTKFNQILINLINNALKFTGEGTVEFGYTHKSVDGKPVIQFYVKDTGIGISKSDQKLVFDRFRQVDVMGRNAYGGTGLGLSICKSFSNLLGGNIQVESEEGKGSVFYFHLPATTGRKVVHEQIPQIEFSGYSSWRGKKILVVEDNDANFLIFKAYLKETGLELIWVKSGEEALGVCKVNKAIDLVLMDIKLPGIDGYEATRIIKAMNKDVPIIAQTAYAMDSDSERSKKAGCDDFISKPILKDKLFNILAKYLD